MQPVPRIVAVCQGGPLDGLRFSHPLSESGNPVPLVLADGTTYYPISELKLDNASTREAVYEGFPLFDDTEGAGGHDLRGAWIYQEK